MEAKPPKSIVWVAAYPKSGSTWCRIILHCLVTGRLNPDINDLTELVGSSFNRRAFDDFIGLPSSDLSFDEVDGLRPALYRQFALDEDYSRVIKVHDRYRKTIQGEPLFPTDITRGAVVIIRNPLDIVASLAHHMDLSIDEAIKMIEDDTMALAGTPNRLARQLRQVLSSWSEHVDSWVSGPDFPLLVIRYEDLLADPLARTKELAAFIGVSRTSAEFKHIVENTRFDKLQAQESVSGFREGPAAGRFFRRGRVGGWREELNDSQVARIIETQGEVMRRHGYIPPEYDQRRD